MSSLSRKISFWYTGKRILAKWDCKFASKICPKISATHVKNKKWKWKFFYENPSLLWPSFASFCEHTVKTLSSFIFDIYACFHRRCIILQWTLNFIAAVFIAQSFFKCWSKNCVSTYCLDTLQVCKLVVSAQH